MVSAESPPLPPSPSLPSWCPVGPPVATADGDSGSEGSGSHDGGGGSGGALGSDRGHGWDIWAAAEQWDAADPATDPVAETAVRDAGCLLDEILGEAHAATGVAF